MSELEDVRYGWDFMARMLGADVAGHSAFSDYMSNVAQNNAIHLQNEHIQQINDAIDQLAQNINEHPHLNLDVEQLKGFVAEDERVIIRTKLEKPSKIKGLALI